MKAFFAKALAWTGGAIGALAASGQFGKFSALAAIVAPLITAYGIHLASQTGPKLSVPVGISNITMPSGATSLASQQNSQNQ